MNTFVMGMLLLVVPVQDGPLQRMWQQRTNVRYAATQSRQQVRHAHQQANSDRVWMQHFQPSTCVNGVCSPSTFDLNNYETWYSQPVQSPVVIQPIQPKVRYVQPVQTTYRPLSPVVVNRPVVPVGSVQELTVGPAENLYGAHVEQAFSGRSGFVRKILKELPEVRRSDPNVSVRDAWSLRTACLLAPAFVEMAIDKAVLQMELDGTQSEHVPVDDDGKVIQAGINWEGLTNFIKVLIPLLIELLRGI